MSIRIIQETRIVPETRAELRRVREVMNADPTTIAPETPVDVLIGLFADLDFEGFPVVDEAGHLIGVVTKLDLLRAVRPRDRWTDVDVTRPVSHTAAELMRRAVMTVEPDDPAVSALDLLLESRFHSVPVVTRTRGAPPTVVGMVSRGDLIRAFFTPAPEPVTRA